MIRSKARWVEFGETPTKYFRSLEKRNYVNNTIEKLITENEEITDPASILKTQAYVSMGNYT